MVKFLIFLLAAIWSVAAFAADTQYQIRVDGLACPYCAYGIEKKLNAIDGIGQINVDLEKGLVTVNVADGNTLSDEQMTELFTDAGFTFRSMIEKAL